MFKNTNLENKFNIFNIIEIVKTLAAVYIYIYIGYNLLKNKLDVKNKENNNRDRTMLFFNSTGLSLRLLLTMYRVESANALSK